MGKIFCPGCKAQTTTRPWDFIPWLGRTKEFFWCRACRQWFAFSQGARQAAFWASIAALMLPILSMRLYFDAAGVQSIRGWPVWAIIVAIVSGYNLASAWVLCRKAMLVGPID